MTGVYLGAYGTATGDKNRHAAVLACG